MRIAIDVDDVLAASLIDFIEFYNRKYGDDLSFDNLQGFTLHESIGIDREEEEMIMREHAKERPAESLPPLEGAAYAIERIRSKHDIMIVTSRARDMEQETKEWLRRHFGEIRDVFFTRESLAGPEHTTKADICIEKGAEMMIEDHPVFAQDCAAADIKVLLFDYPYNKHLKDGPMLKRVHGWRDVLKSLGMDD